MKFLSQNVSIVQPITPEFLFLFFCIALLPFGGLWFQSSDASALLYAIFKLHSLVLHSQYKYIHTDFMMLLPARIISTQGMQYAYKSKFGYRVF